MPTRKKEPAITVTPLGGEWRHDPRDSVATPCLEKGKDQKSVEKRSFRECSTGAVAPGLGAGSATLPAPVSPSKEGGHVPIKGEIVLLVLH